MPLRVSHRAPVAREAEQVEIDRLLHLSSSPSPKGRSASGDRPSSSHRSLASKLLHSTPVASPGAKRSIVSSAKKTLIGGLGLSSSLSQEQKDAKRAYRVSTLIIGAPSSFEHITNTLSPDVFTVELHEDPVVASAEARPSLHGRNSESSVASTLSSDTFRREFEYIVTDVVPNQLPRRDAECVLTSQDSETSAHTRHDSPADCTDSVGLAEALNIESTWRSRKLPFLSLDPSCLAELDTGCVSCELSEDDLAGLRFSPTISHRIRRKAVPTLDELEERITIPSYPSSPLLSISSSSSVDSDGCSPRTPASGYFSLPVDRPPGISRSFGQRTQNTVTIDQHLQNEGLTILSRKTTCSSDECMTMSDSQSFHTAFADDKRCSSQSLSLSLMASTADASTPFAVRPEVLVTSASSASDLPSPKLSPSRPTSAPTVPMLPARSAARSTVGKVRKVSQRTSQNALVSTPAVSISN